LALAQAWLPVLAVVDGALWGLFTYLDHAKEAAKTLAESEQNRAIELKNQLERENRAPVDRSAEPILG
jgi:hypothetical protein